MPILYRKATAEDNFTTFKIFCKSLDDFSQRIGASPVDTGGQDSEKREQLWENLHSLWEHLSRTSDQYWVAEKDNEAIGFARSIIRDDHRELCDFFVLPEHQSAGIGKELIRLAFPNDTPHRSIIATPDIRALSRYLKAGVYPFLNEIYFERIPEPVIVETDLVIESARLTPSVIHDLGEIDLAIIGYRRNVDHQFLITDRTLYIYKRNTSIVGYGYIKKDFTGPFAVLDSRDFPAILAQAETQAHMLGSALVGFEPPTTNTIAIDYLLQRGYRLEAFMGTIMSNKPFGKLENYILTNPPSFL